MCEDGLIEINWFLLPGHQVLVDVNGEEFETFMDILGKLTYPTTPEGAQEITTLISEQAELSADFKV